MSAEQQYEFFKFAYEQENTRHRNLIDRAKLYFAAWSAIIGFLFSTTISDERFQLHFKGAALWSGISAIIVFLFCTSCAIGAAVVLTIVALSIRNYEGLTNLRKAINISQDDETFYMCRIADFVVATERNKSNNDIIARNLRLSLWLGAGGFLLFLLGFVATRLI
jgi:hypothetical protein